MCVRCVCCLIKYPYEIVLYQTIPYARKVILTAYAMSCIDSLSLVEVNLMDKPKALLEACALFSGWGYGVF